MIKKNLWTRNILAYVRKIASRSYQEGVWVHAEGSECDDIDDTICAFFDENYVLEKHQNFGITEKQYELLMKLHGKLREFTQRSGNYYEN